MGRVRVGGRWYLIAIGIPLADKLLVDTAGVALGMTTPDRLLQALTGSAVAVPFVVLLPGLLEELGWRGFGVQAAADEGYSPDFGRQAVLQAVVWCVTAVVVVLMAGPANLSRRHVKQEEPPGLSTGWSRSNWWTTPDSSCGPGPGMARRPWPWP